MELKRFSVATFNLFNLNLPDKPMYRNPTGWTKTEFKAKANWISQQLRRLNADIVGFEELWHREALERVLEVGGQTDDYEVLATPAVGTEITCAAIVRKGLLK